jgi:hypothetical protein
LSATSQLQASAVGASRNTNPALEEAPVALYQWMKACDFSGYEPFDLMNSPYCSGKWARRFPFSLIFRQAGRRFVGRRVRQLMRVPASKNCKALGLVLGGCCDLERLDESWRAEANYIKSELRRLRSPGETHFCWGYDWDAVSIRANVMPKFSPNSVATVFCGEALLDTALVFGDNEALEMAESVGRFIVDRLNRSVDTPSELCFSYTPNDNTRIYNSSVLSAAFLSRLGNLGGNPEYLHLARRAMHYLVNQQRQDGSWFYGAGRMQRWIDSFHTAYNLEALRAYRENSRDNSFDSAIEQGYQYYQKTFFHPDGALRYFNNRSYPIDIHSCSQAIITACTFAAEKGSLVQAVQTAQWTLKHMRAPEGFFYYQRHRFWTNRTPYMRWSEAWMFKALARLHKTIQQFQSVPGELLILSQARSSN